MPHAYVAEPVDLNDLQTLFTDNWDTRSGGEIPLPTFAQTDISRFDPSTATDAKVNIMQGELLEEQVGYAAQHVRRRLPVTLDFWTYRVTTSAGATGRQFMHDIKQELRRIIFANKHSLTSWEFIRYKGFKEIYEDSTALRFHGQITLELEEDGVPVPTEEIVSDDFNRANGASLGGNWTADVGTWGIDTNQADLQSATANAHARYTGSTLKSNLRLEIQIITATNMDAGLIFRWQDTSNYWVARLVETGGVQFVRAYQVVAASFTLVDEFRTSSTSLDWTAGDQVELSVDLQNTLMTISVKGCAIFRREDSYLEDETDHGLYSNSDQVSRFDDFVIYESGGSGR